MSKLTVNAAFLSVPNQDLLLTYEVSYNDEAVPLKLSGLMQFLYQEQGNLSKKDESFLYFLSKITKKFSYQNQVIFGSTDDENMCLFFHEVLEKDVYCLYHHNGNARALDTQSSFPLQISIEQAGNALKCSMSNQTKAWMSDPTQFLFLSSGPKHYCFSEGIIHSVSPLVQDFLGQCLDHNSYHIKQTKKQIEFIKKIYNPYKKKFAFNCRVDFSLILPEEVTPVPNLRIHYEQQILTPTLSYLYNKEVVEATCNENEIIDKRTGKKMTRMPDMEAIYQQDLMALFEQYQLPFMLNNPGDIAVFLDKIIPQLEKQDWKIESTVTDFKVSSEPIDIDISINSSQTDWFYFEPNCSIGDQQFSLQEMARLMVENQGYVQTKKGFVKLSQSAQDDLKFLSSAGAFKVGQTFSKQDILPLIASTKAKSSKEEVATLIDDVRNLNGADCQLADDFKAELRPYQSAGVHWMNTLCKLGQGALLADDMGLGKTIQALAFTSSIEEKGPVLIICPTSLLYNWKSELEKFLPKRSVLVYSGQNRESLLEDFVGADYIICSYGILKNDIQWIQSIEYKAIIVDEAHVIKNPNAQVSKAIKFLQGRFKCVMTGTPIENHLQDLWNLFDFIMPGFLGSKKQFDLLLSDNAHEVLRRKIKPFVLRREKREVLSSLPEKTEVVIKCPLSPQQMQLYKTVLDAAKKGVQGGSKNKLHMLTALLKCRQVCSHPNLVEEFKSLNCPSAKFDILKEKLTMLYNEGHKVVFFSQFTSLLDIVQKWTKEENFNFERLDGSIPSKQRMASVERFQTSDEPSIFLISLKAGGVGLNLTAADYVFHFDPWWNPAIESQATDRVHRMGQENKVFVYKLICEGTIEEKIQDLQDEKRKLLQEIVDIDGATEKAIDFDMLKSVLLD